MLYFYLYDIKKEKAKEADFLKIKDVKELEKIANNVRVGIIEAVHTAKSGHPGGSLSIAEILTVLYFNQMNLFSFSIMNIS